MTGVDPSKYEIDLYSAIVEAVESGAETFWQLISSLPGYYPTVVRDAVEQLINHGRIPATLASEHSNSGPVNKCPAEVDDFPTPHPLDYDWRFTRETSATLLKDLIPAAGPAGMIALLGAPSVFLLAKTLGLSHRIVSLDKNHSPNQTGYGTQKGPTAYRCDLVHDAPHIPAVQSIIADPPWYIDSALDFLQSASQICALGGRILLSFAPDGVRPGLAEERVRVIAEAERLGLRHLATASLALSYSTPFFEYNALRAAGFHFVPRRWRRGDLLLFRKHSEVSLANTKPRTSEPSWTELDIYGVRFKIRMAIRGDNADPRLRSLVPNDILPTVSRRDSRRENVDVWTSGNRVYRCDHTGFLAAILEAMSTRHDLAPSALQSPSQAMNDGKEGVVSRVVKQVRKIAYAERREIKEFYE